MPLNLTNNFKKFLHYKYSLFILVIYLFMALTGPMFALLWWQ